MVFRMSPVYRTPLGVATLAAIVQLLPAAAALAHSHAAIDARFVVEGERIDGTLRLTMRDLRHLVPVDRDRDGRMSPDEVEGARGPLAGYLPQTLKLTLVPGGEPCPATLVDLQIVDVASVEAHLHFRCPRPPVRLSIASGLFGGTGHRYDLRARFRAGTVERQVALSTRQNSAEFSLTPVETRGIPWGPVLAACSLFLIVTAIVVVIALRRRERTRRG